MKAVKRFKQALMRKRPELMQSIFSPGTRVVTPPKQIGRDHNVRTSKSSDVHDRKPLEKVIVAEGVHHDFDVSDAIVVSPQTTDSVEQGQGPESKDSEDHHTSPRASGRDAQESETASHHPPVQRSPTHHSRTRSVTVDDGARGHAHDPLNDTLFLDIGTGTGPTREPADSDPVAQPEDEEAALDAQEKEETTSPDESGETSNIVCESPSAVEMDVYEEAYKQEIGRILSQRGKSATMFLTRRVEGKEEIRQHEGVVGHHRTRSIGSSGRGGGGGGGGGLAGIAKALGKDLAEHEHEHEHGHEQKGSGGLAALVEKAKANAGEDVAADDDKKSKEGEATEGASQH